MPNAVSLRLAMSRLVFAGNWRLTTGDVATGFRWQLATDDWQLLDW